MRGSLSNTPFLHLQSYFSDTSSTWRTLTSKGIILQYWENDVSRNWIKCKIALAKLLSQILSALPMRLESWGWCEPSSRERGYIPCWHSGANGFRKCLKSKVSGNGKGWKSNYAVQKIWLIKLFETWLWVRGRFCFHNKNIWSILSIYATEQKYLNIHFKTNDISLKKKEESFVLLRNLLTVRTVPTKSIR